MAKAIDYTLEDGAALFHAIGENRDALSAKGFTEAKETKFTGIYNTAKQKNAAQVKAEKLVLDLTAQQDAGYEEMLMYIRKVQNSARAAFGNNKTLLKKFYVGTKVPSGCKGIVTWAEYLTGVIFEYGAELGENGWLDEDTTEFTNRHQSLAGIDSQQENAKKLKKVATLSRDTAVKALRDEMIKFRNFIKGAFAGNKEMQIKFKKIPKM